MYVPEKSHIHSQNSKFIDLIISITFSRNNDTLVVYLN